MKIKIRLMADYFCYPLWHDDGINMGDIDPASLPISNELKMKLYHWAELYDNILNMADPASSVFNSKEEEKYFIQMGAELFSQLKVELGDSYEIRYVVTI
ncbi:hypothetical protein [Neisseria basseii]|uniref:hypothetical protein n=1 Tax=Neisseria basseii TaxID=2830650 RepID=UPI00265A9FE5|nr:hypothetical protein [Neisseria basseii]